MNSYVEHKKERNSNLELYRIIVMLLIVAHHYVVNSGLWQVLEMQDFNPNSIFLNLFGMWGKTGINCFVMITGYFMCKSEATVFKFLKLLFEVMFYKIVIYLIFIICGVIPFDLFLTFKALIPLSSVGDGFTTAFILFYLTIPFLNKLIQALNKKRHSQLIILSLFIYTFWDLMPMMTVTYNYVSWFIVLYFISSYIRLYPCERYDTNLFFWSVTTVVLLVLAMFSVLYIRNQGGEFPYRFVSDTNAILALLIGISSFMLFKNLKIKQNRLINSVAASTFGVLLIHANSDAMRQWLWVDTLRNVDWYYTPYCCLHAIVSVIVVYMTCTMIDYLRIRFVEKPMLASSAYNKLECIIENIIIK